MADPIKRLKIIKVTAGYTGTNTNGNPYTIYDILAEGVDKPLRSFDKLPIGENEYEVSSYTKDGKTSYTLKPHGFKVSREAVGGAVSREEFDALDRRVMNLESQLGGSDVTPPAGRDDWPAAGSADDDIPF